MRPLVLKLLQLSAELLKWRDGTRVRLVEDKDDLVPPEVVNDV
jgi:hypothetical protein